MIRRKILCTAALPNVGVAGCLSTSSNPSHTVENPPSWLHEKGDCEDVRAELRLAEKTDSTRSNSGVLQFESFKGDQKTIVEFCVSRGSAVTCERPHQFSKVLGTIEDEVLGPYHENNYENPEYVYIEFENGFRRIVDLVAGDSRL